MRLGWIAEGTYHQQTADGATPHVVPFLIELAADPESPDRSRLLSFLAELVGSDAIDPVPDQEAADRQLAAKVRKYEAQPDSPARFYMAQWRACQVAAWDGADALLSLLADRDPGVRAIAGLAVSLLIKQGGPVLPADAPARVARRLREAIGGEDDPLSRFGHVMALGTAASRYPEARGWLRAIEAEASLDDASGLAAALRLVDLGEPFDAAASRRFVERALRFDAVAGRTLPWWSGPSFHAEPGILRRGRGGPPAAVRPARGPAPRAAGARAGTCGRWPGGRAGQRDPADGRSARWGGRGERIPDHRGRAGRGRGRAAGGGRGRGGPDHRGAVRVRVAGGHRDPQTSRCRAPLAGGQRARGARYGRGRAPGGRAGGHRPAGTRTLGLQGPGPGLPEPSPLRRRSRGAVLAAPASLARGAGRAARSSRCADRSGRASSRSHRSRRPRNWPGGWSTGSRPRPWWRSSIRIGAGR